MHQSWLNRLFDSFQNHKSQSDAVIGRKYQLNPNFSEIAVGFYENFKNKKRI